MNDHAEHQRLRELLGAYVLGHLAPGEAEMIGAHLDGCAECRAIRDEIAPLATRLDDLDPAVFDSPPSPPVGLGSAIRDRIAAARAEHTGLSHVDSDGPADHDGSDRSSTPDRSASPDASNVHHLERPPSRKARSGGLGRPRVRLTAAAAILLVAGVGAGAGIGRATAPQVPTVPLEPIALAVAGGESVTIDSANLVNHTWGVELRFSGEGFTEGDTFRASFRTLAGDLVPAGEFRGTGEATMTCNLQSAVLRDQVSEVVVTDESGQAVLTAPL